MSGPGRAAHAFAVLVLLTVVGCSAKRLTIADTFPKGAAATPWLLEEPVWEGPFERAAEALGDEAEQWRAFDPERAWLAVYQHDTHAEHKLIVRALALPSAKQARRAFDHFRPADADELEAGDGGCWTEDGVLVLWGRMVFDVFGNNPYAFASPEQALYLLAFIEKKMPAGLPDAPE